MAAESFTVGDRVKLRTNRYERKAGALGMVRFAFESTPAYLITFDGETREILVWANLLQRSNDATAEAQRPQDPRVMS